MMTWLMFFYAGGVVGVCVTRVLWHYLGTTISNPILFIVCIALPWPVTMPILIWYAAKNCVVIEPDDD